MGKTKAYILILVLLVLTFTAGCQNGEKRVKEPAPSEQGADNKPITIENAAPDAPEEKRQESQGNQGQNGNGQDSQPGSIQNNSDKQQNGGQKNEQQGSGQQGISGSKPDSPTAVENKKLKDVKVKGIYMTGWTAGSKNRLEHFIKLVNETELNTIVLDIKDDDGYVGYASSIPAVKEINAYENKYNVDEVMKLLKQNDIHVVGRLVCFKDPILSSRRPDLAVKNSGGGLWRDNHDLTWLNPYNRDSWPYLIEIGREAVDRGFDEIQFDYVRFPNDGAKSDMYFGKEAESKEKHEIINEFLAYAQKELGEKKGVKISADVFGIICESPEDTEDIGQYLEKIGKDIEYISPMVYPSHYAVGQMVNGVQFIKPDKDPYGVVFNSLVKAKNRLAAVEGYKAAMRPYLQDFTATWLGSGYYMEYGPDQVRQQVKAVYDAGYDEWILWSAENKYSESALLKQ